MTPDNTPPLNEVDALLRHMKDQEFSAAERKERLEAALKSKIQSIIDVMRISASENPELAKIFDALSDSSISSHSVSEEVYDYPVALELFSALEKGLSNSSHSTVQTTTIPRFISEIDKADMDECLSL